MAPLKSVQRNGVNGCGLFLLLGVIAYLLYHNAGAYLIYVPGLQPYVGRTHKKVDVDIIMDTASQKVWGLRFSSYYKLRSAEMDALEEFKQRHYMQVRRTPALFYQKHSIDSDEKRNVLLYFKEPLDTAMIPSRHDSTLLELKDQVLPPDSTMKMVPVDRSSSAQGYRLVPK